MPRVSVIVPTYNHACYLPQAVQSVLDQTYVDWELIVVDDGSTDHTRGVVAQFTDPRLCCIHQENQGLSAARNTGIRTARGVYLAFLDADDEWERKFLSCCVSVLDSDETLGGCYTLNYFIDNQGDVLPQLGGQVVAPAAFRSRNLEGGFFPIHAALIRASVIDQVGPFDTALTCEEDWDLWIRISKHYTMRGIAEPLARYRVHPGSMSTSVARMHENRVAVLTKHFGPPQGDPTAWSEEKRRAYGLACRSTVIGYLQQGSPDEAWRFWGQAICTWPRLLGRLDTFYELVCGDQSWGIRGRADSLDIERNGHEMLGRLDGLFASCAPALVPMRRLAYGNAYLALGVLSDQAGCWCRARCYLLRAVKANPWLLASYSVVRRLIKLCVGQRVVDFGSRLVGCARPAPVGLPWAETRRRVGCPLVDDSGTERMRSQTP